ncbi:hypothetical protein [Enhygromyxa salina]|uniref:3-oxoacyl-(Acyl carrier protein) synthase n=1 Tax=Enhygromyxa salina TaxID=215803 RepID=A0A2S9Y0C5_9BACT|nr:hypothetical protein [Enhygromyxa salina]PRP98562.1 3-oxoacyl-(acyl carrier protein) synthase [Enhygromyxa salina]
MTTTAHICAIGARTPVGLLAETSAAAVRAGISRITEHPVLLDRHGEPVYGCIDAQLDLALNGAQRLLALSRPALTEVFTKLSANVQINGSVAVLLALPELRPGWANHDSDAVVHGLTATQAPGVAAPHVQVVGHGHAGALHALGLATQQIEAGALELCIVGGVDSYFDGPVLNWLDKRRLLAGNSRAGFIPGEAAAFTAVGSAMALRALGLPSLATVRGWHSTIAADRSNVTPATPGTALADAINTATRGLQPPQERINDVLCDINGERYRSEEWAFTMLHTHARLVDGTRYIAPTSAWGDTGAATGSLLSALAVRAWARGYASGPLAMAWAGSFGGLRSAVVLQAPSV